MSRLGIAVDQLPGVLSRFEDLSALRLAGLCTHLASADLPDGGVTEQALDRFEACIEQARREGFTDLAHHAANSAAAVRFPRARLAAVRPGLALFGAMPSRHVAIADLEPTLRLSTRIMAIHDVPAGTPVSYGGLWRAARPSRIATLPVGYADGYPRHVRDACVLVGGRRVPVVGAVCMDMLMIDVTDVPPADAGLGGAVTLIGRDGAESDHGRRPRGLGGSTELRDSLRHLEAGSAHSSRRARHLRDAVPVTTMSTTSSAENPPERFAGRAPDARAPRVSQRRRCGSSSTTSASARSCSGKALAALFRRPFRLRIFLDQMEFVGVGSLPIIVLVGFFSGAVSAQQAITALRIFNQERFVGATVGISLAQELAPVFTGLMITARAGSGMATELGSMRITEQIDALTTFAVDPIQYLVTPRVIATMLIMPIMTMVFNIVGLLGAYLFSIYLEHIDLGQFIEQFTFWTDPKDYIIGATKARCSG